MRAISFHSGAVGTVRFDVAARGKARHATELELIRAASRGDRIAFDTLANFHREALRRFVQRRVGDPDAEDLIQDALLAAWEHFPTYAGTGNFRTWLFSISLNKIRDYWRRGNRRPTTTELQGLDGILCYMPGEYAAIEVREAMRPVWNCFTRDQRELLDLYYSEGFTLKEISQVLARNLNTVKYQFYRAHEDAARALQIGEYEAANRAEVLL